MSEQKEQWFKTTTTPVDIKAVLIDRYTDKTVWIDGRRKIRNADFESYHPTLKGAKEKIIAFHINRVERARTTFNRAASKLEDAVEKVNKISDGPVSGNLKNQ